MRQMNSTTRKKHKIREKYEGQQWQVRIYKMKQANYYCVNKQSNEQQTGMRIYLCYVIPFLPSL